MVFIAKDKLNSLSNLTNTIELYLFQVAAICFLLLNLNIAEASLEGCQGCQLTLLEFWRLAHLKSNLRLPVDE